MQVPSRRFRRGMSIVDGPGDHKSTSNATIVVIDGFLGDASLFSDCVYIGHGLVAVGGGQDVAGGHREEDENRLELHIERIDRNVAIGGRDIDFVKNRPA